MESQNIPTQSNTYHTGALVNSGGPVFILPAEERGEGDDDRHEPDAGDQHPDGAGAPGVDVVRICHSPEPSIISPTLFLKVFQLRISIEIKTQYPH